METELAEWERELLESGPRRRVVRRWSGRRPVVRVATVHPTLGELPRGTIHTVPAGIGWRMSWRVTDQDGHDLGMVAGDYLDAERVLLDGTGWADQVEINEE